MKKKFFSVLLATVALVLLTACSGVSGKYYYMSSDSSGGDDTYIDFKDKKFMVYSGNEIKMSGTVDDSKSTLTVTEPFSLSNFATYKLEDDVLILSRDGEEYGKYVKEGSEQYKLWKNRMRVTKELQEDRKKLIKKYNQTLSKLSKRLLKSFLSKTKGTWRGSSTDDSSDVLEITDTKMTVKDKYSTYEYNIKEAVSEATSDSNYGLSKFYDKVNNVSASEMSSEVEDELEDDIETMNNIKDWSDYVKATNSHEIIISFTSSINSGVTTFYYNEDVDKLNITQSAGRYSPSSAPYISGTLVRQ